jgi:hypothetical protein
VAFGPFGKFDKNDVSEFWHLIAALSPAAFLFEVVVQCFQLCDASFQAHYAVENIASLVHHSVRVEVVQFNRHYPFSFIIPTV